MTHLLHLLVRCGGGIRLRAGINGVTLATDRKGLGFFSRAPLNEWLRPDGNRLDVEAIVVSPPLTDEPPNFEVAICFPDDEQPPLVRFDWRATKLEEFAPFRFSLPFVLPMPCPTKLFVEAEVIAADDEKARKEALACAKAAYDAFAARDVDRIIDLFGYRLEDNARGWINDPADAVSRARMAYASFVAPDGFSLYPWENIETRLVADGRAVFVSRQQGFPLIGAVKRPGVAPSALDIYVARIDGKWRVVR